MNSEWWIVTCWDLGKMTWNGELWQSSPLQGTSSRSSVCVGLWNGIGEKVMIFENSSEPQRWEFDSNSLFDHMVHDFCWFSYKVWDCHLGWIPSNGIMSDSSECHFWGFENVKYVCVILLFSNNVQVWRPLCLLCQNIKCSSVCWCNFPSFLNGIMPFLGRTFNRIWLPTWNSNG